MFRCSWSLWSLMPSLTHLMQCSRRVCVYVCVFVYLIFNLKWYPLQTIKKKSFFFGEPDYYGTQMMTTMTMMMLTVCCRRFNSFDCLSVLSSLIIIIARCAWAFESEILIFFISIPSSKLFNEHRKCEICVFLWINAQDACESVDVSSGRFAFQISSFQSGSRSQICFFRLLSAQSLVDECVFNVHCIVTEKVILLNYFSFFYSSFACVRRWQSSSNGSDSGTGNNSRML